MVGSESRFLIGTAEQKRRYLKVNKKSNNQQVFLTSHRNPNDQLQKILCKANKDQNKSVELRFDKFPQPRIATTHSCQVLIEPEQPGWYNLRIIILKQRKIDCSVAWSRPQINSSTLEWDNTRDSEFLVLLVDQHDRFLCHDLDSDQLCVRPRQDPPYDTKSDENNFVQYLWVMECVDHNLSKGEVAMAVLLPTGGFLVVGALFLCLANGGDFHHDALLCDCYLPSGNINTRTRSSSIHLDPAGELLSSPDWNSWFSSYHMSI